MLRRVLCAIAFGLLVPAAGWSCTCILATPHRAFRQSERVVIGTASVDANGVTTVTVEESFKGPRATPLVLGPQSSCSLVLEHGQRYLLYAFVRDGAWDVSYCTRSKRLQDADCDVRILRSRAWWWRTPFSRLVPKLRNRMPCP